MSIVSLRDLINKFKTSNGDFLNQSNRKTKLCDKGNNCTDPVSCNYYHTDLDKRLPICIDYLFGIKCRDTRHEHIKLPTNINNIQDPEEFSKELIRFLEIRYIPKIQKNIKPKRVQPQQPQQDQPVQPDLYTRIRMSGNQQNFSSPFESGSIKLSESFYQWLEFKEHYSTHTVDATLQDFLNKKGMANSDIDECQNLLNRIVSETTLIKNYKTCYASENPQFVYPEINSVQDFYDYTKIYVHEFPKSETYSTLDTIIFNLYCLTNVYSLSCNCIRKTDIITAYKTIYTNVLDSISSLLGKFYISKKATNKTKEYLETKNRRLTFDLLYILKSKQKFIHISYHNIRLAFINFILEQNIDIVNYKNAYSKKVIDFWNHLDNSEETSKLYSTLNIETSSKKEDSENLIKWWKNCTFIKENTKTNSSDVLNDSNIDLAYSRLLWNMLDPIYHVHLATDNVSGVRTPNEDVSKYFNASSSGTRTLKSNALVYKVFDELVYRIINNPDYLSLPKVSLKSDSNCKFLNRMFESRFMRKHIVSNLAMNMLNSPNIVDFNNLSRAGELQNIVSKYININDYKTVEVETYISFYIEKYIKINISGIVDNSLVHKLKTIKQNKNKTCPITRTNIYSENTFFSMISV
jgi:hypothetical protein